MHDLKMKGDLSPGLVKEFSRGFNNLTEHFEGMLRIRCVDIGKV